ncbi:hypothetical protein ACFU8T_20440 [Sphingobacterium spiritivorum]|uniref:DUF4468 domain-containing protein n=1 Tax=Sphingobacterium spiritivorum ATCC 33861 TaxID=525373 RepID=D7VTZ5_SPHSI|nr:hypothetical protein [Sphingobacterium spiritivorum]EFK55774.1 hypothetical protein HMPREF0766_14465 [Sphingobacterium spiritivorum ATCC 33861]QQT34104.1 hypothetical protein I6J01_12185 [Sphingobacterium spiritivorum]WQD34936.1 hypothetical protein U0038_04130 [Sphingobacterium spiritivorum]SUI98668.1 Uncharacterised protein [Sphingobacterium spiritivorum]
MKVFNIIILMNIFLFGPLQAQTKLDTCQDIILKGYVITQYKRSDIKSIKNVASHMIDFYHREYFIPLKNNLDQVTIDSINVFNPDEVYFLPSNETYRLMIKYCNKYKNKESYFSTKVDLNSFFKVGKKNSEFLYKIYYYECKAVKSEIANNSLNAFQLNVPFKKESKFLNCYFIYQNVIMQEIKRINSENFYRVKRSSEINANMEQDDTHQPSGGWMCDW